MTLVKQIHKYWLFKKIILKYLIGKHNCLKIYKLYDLILLNLDLLVVGYMILNQGLNWSVVVDVSIYFLRAQTFYQF